MKKRLLSMILAVSMMLTFLPVGAVTAFANNGSIFTDTNQIKYKLNDTTMTATVIGSDRTDWPANGTVTIQSYVGNNGKYKVTAIEHDAFNQNRTIAGQLIIPDTVTSIGSYAFSWCDKLTGDLSIPNGVTTISTFAFYGCTGLTGTLTLPDTVTTIETKAFSGCSGLTELVLSKKLETIGENAFSSCSSLKGDLEIPEGVTTIGNSAFSSCTSLNGKITIPGSIVSIGNFAFSSCSQVKSVEILDGVTRIGAHAFETCTSLSDLKIPSSVKTIENNAFNGCIGLTSVPTIPEGVQEIGDYAFNACNLNGTLVIPNTVTSIGNSAFGWNSGLNGEFRLPEGIKKIGANAFCTSSIIQFVLPKNLHDAVFAANAFSTYKVTKIYYPGYKAEWDNTRSQNNNIEGLQADGLIVSNIPILYFCDVTFNPNGGTFEDGTSAPVTIKEIWRTEKVATKGDVPANPTRKGYVFDGWYYTDNVARAMTAFDPATEGVPDTITLYAAWRQTDTLATVAISGLSDGDTLVKGKEYPFTVKITPDGDAGNGKLTLTLANGGTLYQQKDDGTWEEMTSSELDIALVSKSYQFKLVPDQTGPNTLTAGVQKDGLTGAPNTDEVSFTVRDYEDGTVTIEGLDNVTLNEEKSHDFTVRVDPKDDTGKGKIDFGGKNGEVQYKDGDDWKDMPADGLEIDLDDGAKDYEFRITPKMSGEQTLTVTVTKENGDELGKAEAKYTVNKKDVFHTLTVIGGTVKVDGTAVAPDADNSYPVKEDAVVEVSFDRSILSDAQTFDQWTISDKSLLGDPDVAYDEETFTFTMPHADVKIESMTRDASIDEGPNLLEKGAAAGTVIVGGVVLLYQGHMLGTELYLRYLLPHGAIVPQNRAELAVLLWQDAGNPEPVSTALYSDISNEDSAIQQAARWAVENDLMELLDADEHPDHFDPFAPVTFTDSIHAWKKAQERKQTPTT